MFELSMKFVSCSLLIISSKAIVRVREVVDIINKDAGSRVFTVNGKKIFFRGRNRRCDVL